MSEKDYTICENIGGDINRQTRIQCYNDVAATLKNDSICDKMDVPDYEYLDLAKQQCKQYVALR